MNIEDIRRALADYRKRRIDPKGLIPAAVLFPVVEGTPHGSDDGLRVMLLQRSKAVEHHKGEVGFPGGRIDPSDPGPLDAALREAYEETGLLREQVEIIGELDDYVTVTGYHITPFVGVLTDVHDLAPRTIETTEIFFVPMSFFEKPGHVSHTRIIWQGQPRTVYTAHFHDKFIWGATLAMIMRFLEVIKHEGR